MKRKAYKAVQGSRINNKDAQIIGKRIEYLKPKGYITAEELLADAKKKSSSLHSYFEWNNKQAAQLFRLDQARYLIRSINVIIIDDGKEIETRAFHHLKITDDEEAYVDYKLVFSNRSYYKQVLEMAIQEIKGWQERYQNYRELSEIFRVISKTEKKIFKKKR